MDNQEMIYVFMSYIISSCFIVHHPLETGLWNLGGSGGENESNIGYAAFHKSESLPDEMEGVKETEKGTKDTLQDWRLILGFKSIEWI